MRAQAVASSMMGKLCHGRSDRRKKSAINLALGVVSGVLTADGSVMSPLRQDASGVKTVATACAPSPYRMVFLKVHAPIAEPTASPSSLADLK